MLQMPGQKRSIALPILTAALAAGIFAADTATQLDIAVPVLYVAVVLISVQFCERRGVLLVGAGVHSADVIQQRFIGDRCQTNWSNQYRHQYLSRRSDHFSCIKN